MGRIRFGYLLPWALVVQCLFLGSADSSHFRGITMSWKATSDSSQVDVEWWLSYRRSSQTPRCDDDDLINGTMVYSSPNLICDQCFGNYSVISPGNYQCADYSEAEDWQAGIGSTRFTIQPGIEAFDISYTSCCWISLGNGGSSGYSAQAHVNLTLYNGKINSSPVTSWVPIFRIQQGCQATLNIPVSDPDDDEVRCRWPYSSSEGGGVNRMPNAVLNEISCVMTINALTASGWYAVALVIEDFPSPTSMTAKSKVPLQFLVNIYDGFGGNNCTDKPILINPTPDQGDCRSVSPGVQLSLQIRAIASNAEIIEFETTSPIGMTTSPVSLVPGKTNEYYVTATWTPTSSQEGQHLFCFNALDADGLTSEVRCVHLSVKDPPTVIETWPAPDSNISVNLGPFTFQFDQNVTLAAIYSTVLRIYSTSSTGWYSGSVTQHDNDAITFSPSYPSPLPYPDALYTVVLSAGVVASTGSCPIPSASHSFTVYTLPATPGTTPHDGLTSTGPSHANQPSSQSWTNGWQPWATPQRTTETTPPPWAAPQWATETTPPWPPWATPQRTTETPPPWPPWATPQQTTETPPPWPPWATPQQTTETPPPWPPWATPQRTTETTPPWPPWATPQQTTETPPPWPPWATPQQTTETPPPWPPWATPQQTTETPPPWPPWTTPPQTWPVSTPKSTPQPPSQTWAHTPQLTTPSMNTQPPPLPSMDCSDSGMTVFIPRSVIGDASASHLHFMDPTCVGSHHNGTHVKIATTYNRCGTFMEVRGENVIFFNVIHDEAVPVSPGSVITRDRNIEIPVQCIMDLEGMTEISFRPDTSKITFREDGYGSFNFSLSLYHGNDYATPYLPADYPIHATFGDKLYFEARTWTEPGLELFVQACRATPTSNPDDFHRYTFIKDGCIEDTTMVIHPSFDPDVERFEIDVFGFINTLSQPVVYVHCDMVLCNSSDPYSICSIGCPTLHTASLLSMRRRHARSTTGSHAYAMTQGPISLIEQQGGKEFSGISSSTQMPILLATVCLLVGCVLVLGGVVVVMRKRSRRLHVYVPVPLEDEEE